MEKKELMELIERTTYEVVNRLEPKERERLQFCIQPSAYQNKRYNCYLELLDQIVGKQIRGEPDTFIEAACMCAALVKYKCVVFNMVRAVENPIREFVWVNYEIALEVALSMLKEVYVYEEQGTKWVPIRKVTDRKVTVPNGMIPKSCLKEKIICNLMHENISGQDLNVMQFSNMLHLIYLLNL